MTYFPEPMFSTFRLILVALALSLFGSSAIFAQAIDRVEAKPKNLPTLVIPESARKSGLVGTVSVLVEVDQDGNVTNAANPTGPDWVCPGVMRPDVLTMRESAIEAAKRTKFYPATENGTPVSTTLRIDLHFGSKKPEPKIDNASGATVIGEAAPNSGGGLGTDHPFARRLDMTTVSAPNENPKSSGPRPNGSNAPLDPTKTISGGVLNGKAIDLPKPKYPPAARAVHAGGAVQIEILILEDGSVFSAEPLGGHPLLQSVSRIAACDASFTPTLLQGQPVKVSGIIVYNFVP